MVRVRDREGVRDGERVRVIGLGGVRRGVEGRGLSGLRSRV